MPDGPRGGWMGCQPLPVLTWGLLVGHLQFAIVDLGDEVLRRLAVHGAADGGGRAQDLLHGAAEVAGHRALPHHARRLEHVVHRDVAVVLHCGGGRSTVM